MLKPDLIKCLLKDSKIRTDIQVVASTYTNISFNTLSKKLSLLNAIINKILFKYYQKYPEMRVAFYCNHESVPNNTHSHILLSIPNKYNNKINYILNLLKEKFLLLDDRIDPIDPYNFYVDTNVKSEFKNTRYATKKYDEDNYNFVVI